MRIVALSLVVWSSTHAPTRIDETRSYGQIEQPYRSAPRLTAKQKAWFQRAIEHILQGD